MGLTDHLPAERRPHVEIRLRTNLMAWLTTISPSGRRIGAIFGTPERFAAAFSAAIVITPTKLHG